MEGRNVIWLAVLLVILAAVAAAPFVIERWRPAMDAAQRKSAPGSFVTLSQGVTHYQWIGPLRGPIAVCVHGLTTPSFVWHGMAAELSALGYRVLIYDLYGRGYSDAPAGPQTADFFVTQLEDLLADQGIKGDITLFGYSMGGAISTNFAARHPDMIRHLILLAPAGFAVIRSGMTKFIKDTPLIGDWLMLTMFPRMHRKGTEAERHLPTTVPNVIDLQQAELHKRGFIPAVLASLRGTITTLEAQHRTLHSTRVPVLAVWGRDDAVIPLAAAGLLAQWNHDARQEVIDGAGHGLTYTHTTQVIDALRDVLNEGLR